jgi:hypothetical protein
MKIAYGYSVTRNDDPFVALAEEGMRVGSLGGAPGKWLVDSLPFRKSRYLDNFEINTTPSPIPSRVVPRRGIQDQSEGMEPKTICSVL